ncbi:FadR/GntR family transcriptional regulator [Aeromicrobium sp. CF4.19]|uniref:FadR/GntR family transcriptional regulator n=1 Tax=Aeromicrobium sp. CF4.19 TaxID=3373082 RepID=UPI003EE58BF1
MADSPSDPVPSGAPVLARVRSGNVFEETMEHLLRMIRLGEFGPGSKLPAERVLSEQLGISRATLREALGELQVAGYVSVQRGRYGGTYIADLLPAPSAERPLPDTVVVEDVLTLRAVVEPAAARLAAERAGREGRERITSALADLEAADPAQYRPLDAQLHLRVAELSGSPSLVAVVADARARVNELLECIPLLPTNLEHSQDQHELVVRAIRDGDGPAAEAAMAQHLEGTAWLLRGFLG